MKSKLGWIVAGIIGFLLILALAGMAVARRFWYGAWYGRMMGRDFDGGMMGGFNPRGFYPMHTFGWGGMIFGWLIALGIITLIVVAVIALVNGAKQPVKPVVATGPAAPQEIAPQAVATTPCSNCGRPTQPDWSTCPYCGNSLTHSEPPA